MTIRLTYVLTPQGRLSPGRGGQSGNTRDIDQIIPGSAVRGALGAAWWTSPESAFEPSADRAVRQAAFDRFFGEVLSVGPAEPTLDPAAPRDRKVVSFIPNSVLSCKYDCGAAPLDRAQPLPRPGPCCATADEEAQRGQICPRCGRCPCCVANIPDSLGIKAVEGKGWHVRAATRSFVVRAALDHGIPKEGALFTRAVLEPKTRDTAQPVVYAGVLEIRGAAADANPDAMPALAWLRAVKIIRVGGSLGTMGKCRIDVGEAASQPRGHVDKGRAVVYLTTPAILVDRTGSPTLDIRSQIEMAARRAGAESARVTMYWARPATASGWHGLAGLPKPQDLAVEAGATAVLESMTDAALAQLLDEGLGIRRLEGHGRLSCDPAATQWAPGAPHSSEIRDQDREKGTNDEPTPADAQPSAIAELLASVPGERRELVARRLLDATRKAQRMRESGNDVATLETHFNRTLGQPWARDLSGPIRDDIRQLIRQTDLIGVAIELESWTGGGA